MNFYDVIVFGVFAVVVLVFGILVIRNKNNEIKYSLAAERLLNHTAEVMKENVLQKEVDKALETTPETEYILMKFMLCEQKAYCCYNAITKHFRYLDNGNWYTFEKKDIDLLVPKLKSDKIINNI